LGWKSYSSKGLDVKGGDLLLLIENIEILKIQDCSGPLESQARAQKAPVTRKFLLGHSFKIV
jgi:hypothetical protein